MTDNAEFDFTLPVDDFSFESLEAELPAVQPEEEPEVEEEDTGGEDAESQEEARKPEFSKEELMMVFDQILFEGTYTEKGSIRGKLPFEFRMRSTKDVSEISRRIDKSNFSMMATIEQHVAVLNLAYSLVSFKGEDLSKLPPLPTKQGEKCRADFINKLPSAISSALYWHLSKFDRKIQQALIEAEENF